jgi:hypothetical protein
MSFSNGGFSGGGSGGTLLSITGDMVPDYTKPETITLDTTSYTWTALKVGYVWLRLSGSSPEMGRQLSFTINDSIVLLIAFINTNVYQEGTVLVPVNKGDILKLTATIEITGNTYVAMFYPPKGVYPPQINSNMVPDYNNMDPTNHISSLNGSWAPMDSGYVFIDCSYTATAANQTLLLHIDGTQLLESTSSASGNQVVIEGLFPVKAGDLVEIVSNFTGTASCSCKFIPPIAILPPTVEISESTYGYEEKRTHETWIDGKPVYVRTFKVTAPKKGQGTDTVLMSGVDTAIRHTTSIKSTKGVYCWTTNNYCNASNEWRCQVAVVVKSTYDMAAIIYVGNVGDNWFEGAEVTITVHYTKL